jgi:F-type H+-transporting ATPase subunit epsilon
MNSFEAQILTPEGPLFDGEVTGVRVPGAEGSFEVKTGHAPIISTLEPGKLVIRKTDGQESTFAVSGGLLEVHNNMLNLLAESAEHINQIDAERAKNAKERARERLKDSAIDDTVDKERAQKAKDRADNRIKLSIDVTVDTNTG